MTGKCSPALRVVVAHNRYQFAGGEDSVVRNEIEMLRSSGHEVRNFEAENRTIRGPVAEIAAAASLFHSPNSRRKMTELIREFRPDVLHVHNWFPLLSPSIHRAAAEAGVPVVQALHNFRMVCANSALFRDGRICHDCLGKPLALDPIFHACYRGNRAASAAVAAGFAYHRFAGTWDAVTLFLAVSEFQRELLVRGGVGAAKTVVKPNFVRDGGVGDGRGGHVLFAGRLTAEKGIRTVLHAWESNRKLPLLKIMGDGPLADEVRTRAAQLQHVEYLGQQPQESAAEAMRGAAFLLFASECYEALPLVMLEAFSCGTPVLAAALPSVMDMVRDGDTGLRFQAGDAADLATKVFEMISIPERYAAMRARCRSEYERKYSEQINYRRLMEIYGMAMAERERGNVPARHLTATCA
jgi:glycosyltransferase involved in cell wall biosynthesis